MTLLWQHFLIFCLLFFPNPSQGGEEPKLRVALSHKPLQTLTLPMEKYVVGVLAAEVPREWPQEALKAQAVAARSYALYRKRQSKDRGYDIEANISEQDFLLQEDYPLSFSEAVRATRSETLRWQGEVIPAFFHSCCGGHSELPTHVWNKSKALPYYAIKEDPYCAQCPGSPWQYRISKAELSLLLQQERLGSGSVDHIFPHSWDGSRRFHEVAVITDVETIALKSNRLRQLLGYDRIRSTVFNIMQDEEDLIFVGSGYGHGVGLCQWGARGMAQQGKGYREILNFYYPGVEIKRGY